MFPPSPLDDSLFCASVNHHCASFSSSYLRGRVSFISLSLSLASSARVRSPVDVGNSGRIAAAEKQCLLAITLPWTERPFTARRRETPSTATTIVAARILFANSRPLSGKVVRCRARKNASSNRTGLRNAVEQMIGCYRREAARRSLLPFVDPRSSYNRRACVLFQNFVVRQSSQSDTMALSVRLPTDKGPYIEHYLIQANKGKLSLETSENRFDNIPSLIAHYSQCW